MATATKARLNGTTSIHADTTEMEIKKYLRGRGAENPVVAQDDDNNRIVVMFRLFGRVIQMEQRLLTKDAPLIQKSLGVNQHSRYAPSDAQVKSRLEAETNRRWRVMLMRIKLRLDLIFDEEDQAEREAMFRLEFLPDTSIPGGGTVREFMEPQVAEAYKTGKMPALLPGPGAYHLLETEAAEAGKGGGG